MTDAIQIFDLEALSLQRRGESTLAALGPRAGGGRT